VNPVAERHLHRRNQGELTIIRWWIAGYGLVNSIQRLQKLEKALKCVQWRDTKRTPRKPLRNLKPNGAGTAGEGVKKKVFRINHHQSASRLLR